MNIKKRGSITIILLFLTFMQFPTIAQQQEDIKKALIAKIDSSNNNLLKLDEIEIDRMTTLAMTSGEYTTLAIFFRNNKKYGAENMILMRKYSTTNNLDSIYYHYKEASKYYSQENNPDNNKQIIKTQIAFIMWCISNNYYELGIKAIEQNIKYNLDQEINYNHWIYISLQIIYRQLGKYEQAIEAGKTALKEVNKLILTTEDEYNFKASTYSEFAEDYLALNNYKECLASSDSILYYIRPATNNINLQFDFHNVSLVEAYAYKAVSYSYMDNFKQALLMLQKIEDPFQNIIASKKLEAFVPKTVIDELIAKYNWAYMIYYYQMRNYTKATEYLNNIKELLVTPSLSPDCKNFLKWEALLLEKRRKYPETIQVLKQQQYYTDSINRVNTAKDINSLWAVFEVDKAQYKQEQSEFKVKVITWVTVGIVLTAIALIAYFIVTTKKLKEKNKVLFKQQKDLLSSIPNITTTQNKSMHGIPLNEISQDQIIQENPDRTRYLQIIEYLKTTQQYTDPDLSREQVAKELGTNRQYIIDAISNNANMSFNEFINNFRVDYARDLLLSGQNLTIKKIYTEAGFNSHSTFSILFKEKFGMTPSEFRNCAREDVSK
jgi:AraC-like DNA-binding protein